MSSKSNTLFHFTKNIDFLKSILVDGFWPRFCLEEHNWRRFDYEAHAYPIVCFCDIPLSRVAAHCLQYGSYGIGVSKSWASAHKLNPVIYIQTDSLLFDGLNKLFQEHARGPFFDGSGNVMYNEILPFIKPTLSADESTQYTLENEWRYVLNNPAIERSLHENACTEARLQQVNNRTKSNSLPLSVDDIQYIIVSTETERIVMIEYLRKHFTDNASNGEVDVLISRIISMEHISKDF